MSEASLNSVISILIPLMLLVIMEIAGVAREMDLGKQKPDIQTTYKSRAKKRLQELTRSSRIIENINPVVPPFGHFGMLHALNSVILLYGAGLVNYGVTGPTRHFLSGTLIFLLIILPYLEVDEYSEIRRNGEPVLSIRSHQLTSLILGILASGMGLFIKSRGFSVATAIAIFLLVILPFVFSQIYFIDRLATEVRNGIVEGEH